MTAFDYRAKAAELRRDADTATRRSAKNARRAAQAYEHARSYRRLIRWIDACPGVTISAIDAERSARAAERLGDAYLAGVFQAQSTARTYREVARSYDRMAEAADSRFTRLMTEPVF